MDFGPAGNGELKSICEQLGRTEIMGSGTFLKSGLSQISQILTGAPLVNSNPIMKGSMNRSSISKMKNSYQKTANMNIHMTPNNNVRRQSTGINSSRRSIANSNRSIRINSSEDPRGTVQRVIIDGDTKHNTPNRIIRSRTGSTHNSLNKFNETGNSVMSHQVHL
jgi:hypothetical protein